MTELTQTVTVGGMPGSPDGAHAAEAGRTMTVQADPRAEYVAAGGFSWYSNFIRSLPWSIDDVTRDFGDDIYEVMLRDPQLLACLNIFKAMILEDGAQLAPACTDETDPTYALAQELHEVCTRMIEALNPALDDVLWDMLDGMAYGNKVAETVWSDVESPTGPRQLWVSALKVKPRRSVAFVVDVYQNVVGLLGRIPGVGMPVQAGSFALGTLAQQVNLLPREKFAVFTFRPKDGDPRGTSILRAAYNAWWLKMQTWPEYLKFLVQFASPSLIGFVAPNAQTYTAPGAAQKSPEQLMVDTLIQMRNGTAAAFPNGASVEPLVMSSEGGQGFLDAFALFDRQITKAILHQTLATEEGQHQARAASSVHQDVLQTMVRQAKKGVCRMLRNDVLMPFVRFNYGEQAVQLTPQVTLGAVEQTDFSAMAQAIAALTSSQYLDPSQFPAIDALLSLPTRTPSKSPEQEPPGKQQPPSDPTKDGQAQEDIDAAEQRTDPL